VCHSTEIAPGKPYVFNLNNDIEIVIFQTDQGYYALENRCPHAGAHLHEGIIKDNILTCIWHGWRFDLETGQCLNEYWAKILTYAVILKGNEIYLKKKHPDDRSS
jgi:nitrite reductase/ring-hydroxylating ferredoxin subunit